MIDFITKWSKEEFKIFLLIYAAQANLVESDEEFDFISLRQSSGDMIILDDVNSSFPEVEKFLDEQKKIGDYNIQKIKSTEERAYAVCEKR